MTNDDSHIVIVNFEIEPGEQAEALEKIGSYVATFLSQQPGFIESALHAGLDGNRIVHYARWKSEADFKAAGEGARAHPDMPALLAYKPSGQGYRVWKTY
jgi:heme-degrading monooxygenase HmoA